MMPPQTSLQPCSGGWHCPLSRQSDNCHGQEENRREAKDQVFCEFQSPHAHKVFRGSPLGQNCHQQGPLQRPGSKMQGSTGGHGKV